MDASKYCGGGRPIRRIHLRMYFGGRSYDERAVPELKAGFEKAAWLSSDELRPFWGKAGQTATAAFQIQFAIGTSPPMAFDQLITC
jgi:hypothetical protein